MYKVYFKNKVVVFTSDAACRAECRMTPLADERITVAKVLQNLENYNSLAIISPRADEVFADFRRGFRCVDAAGGVVCDPHGRRLMILRDGRWDLPKGHREAGESMECCALREVAEECGIEPRLGEHLADTLHFYPWENDYTLKRTAWYRMYCEEPGAPVPQTEEGITQAVWLDGQGVEQALENTFSTIRRVMECEAERA